MFNLLVGDEVHHMEYGFGVITEQQHSDAYYQVKFDDKTVDGVNEEHLYFIKGTPHMYRIGDKVSHEEYGEGVILGVDSERNHFVKFFWVDDFAYLDKMPATILNILPS
jgi:hypothetical protein